MDVFLAMFADAPRRIHIHGVVKLDYSMSQSRMEIARTDRIVFQKAEWAGRPWSHHRPKVTGHRHGYDTNRNGSCLDYERKVSASAYASLVDLFEASGIKWPYAPFLAIPAHTKE